MHAFYKKKKNSQILTILNLLEELKKANITCSLILMTLQSLSSPTLSHPYSPPLFFLFIAIHLLNLYSLVNLLCSLFISVSPQKKGQGSLFVVFTDVSHAYNDAQHIVDAQQIFIEIKAVSVLGKAKLIGNIYLAFPMCQVL